MSRIDEYFRAKRRAALGLDKPKPHNVSWGRTPIPATFYEEATGTKPDPALKGTLGGNCYRGACQAPGATWWNTSTRKYYCAACARDINRAGAQFGESPILFPSAGAEADAAMKYGDQR